MIERTRQKFEVMFSILENGAGSFMGAMEDIALSGGSTISWVAPRRILKVNPLLGIKGGMVIQSPGGVPYMVAGYSLSETSDGTPFRAFKLYEASARATLIRRSTVIEPRTGLPKEGPKGPPILIYAAFEPLQEAFDRELRIPNEKTRLVTNYAIQEGDIINGEAVIEVHPALGVYGAVLG